MTYLLDVSTLLGWLVSTHAANDRVLAWEDGKQVAVCPITELGFVRIACNTFNVSLDDARAALVKWKRDRQVAWIPCDTALSEGLGARSWRKLTDFYLANLAGKHRMRLATLDEDIKHPATEVIPE